VLRAALPLLAGALVAGVPPPVLAGLAAAVAVAGAPLGLLAWWRFRYRVGGGVLEVEGGVLARRRRVVPLERIRGVVVDEPLPHRLAGLVRVRVEAAASGDSGGELALAAVSRAQAAALREAVLVARPSGPLAAEAPGTAPDASPGPGLLAVAGLTSGRYVLVPAAVVAAALNLADDVGLGRLARRGAEAALDVAPRSSGGVAAVVGLAALVTAVAAALGGVVGDWRFTLRIDGVRIHTVRGLLSRRTSHVDRGRVQAVEVLDNPPRRVLGLAALQAAVAGVSAGGDGDAAGRVPLLPIGRGDEVWALARRLAPGAPGELRAHPPAGRRRRVVRAVALPGIGLGAAALAGAPAAVVALAAGAVAVMAVVGLDRHRQAGHALGARLVLRGGSPARRTSLVDPSAPVAYSVRTSPSQRRLGLCTLRVHLGRGAGTRTAVDMADEDARRLVAALQPWTARSGGDDPQDGVPRGDAA
jgi:putative membrane protein